MIKNTPAFRPRANCGIGAIASLDGKVSHGIVSDALDILERLEHRGARGAEENTGDGAGIMLQKPDGFFRARVAGLPDPDAYLVGQLFLPRESEPQQAVMRCLEATLEAEGFELLAWRDVPTDMSGLGRGALDTTPEIRQLFLRHRDGARGSALDRHAFVLRRLLEKAVRDAGIVAEASFSICSMDRRRLVYKGQLTNSQLRTCYPDLADPELTSPWALVHSRFSTNTLGSWALAHPHQTLVHNGEINTLQGNFNHLRSREAELSLEGLEADLARIIPLARPGISDSALLDTALELLLASGRGLAHALRLLIPEAWQKNPQLSPQRRAWYDYHSTLMEPWDGPALVVASDGERLAAIQDRNGFRPARYDLTRDGRLILASEAGVIDLAPEDILRRGRLGPGEMLLVDPKAGGLLEDEAVFARLTRPEYAQWLQQRLHLGQSKPWPLMPPDALPDLSQRQRAAGYTQELLDHLLRPMAEDGKDPVGAMGDDAAPAALAPQEHSLFDYFKQRFAQVSNPPIDYLREEHVTTLETHIGPQRNLMTETADHCRRIHLDSPLLGDEQLQRLTGLASQGFACRRLALEFVRDTGLRQALTNLQQQAEAVANEGIPLLLLSDRGMDADHLALPSLLAVGAVHHHLIRQGLRSRVALVLEVADACTVHHLATLMGYGADAVNPYLALASLGAMGGLQAEAPRRYRQALEDGLLKVMSKMGISTLESYKGSQLFEALGLADEVVDTCFVNTPSRIGGSDFARLEQSLRARHQAAYRPLLAGNLPLPNGGALYWRRDGHYHGWNPQTLGLLQAAVRQGDERLYRAFSRQVDEPAEACGNLRGLLDLRLADDPLPLEEVEPVEAITRRFFSGAMSLGSLSPEAHETLAMGMNQVGGMAHSGEGGEPAKRLGTERECRNKQIASGRFGVTAAYLAGAAQLEIKMAQGAKPGEGGQLPGHKVDPLIASLRHTTPGVGLISPPPHHDIYSIEDLAQLIHDLRCANPEAEVMVKLVAEAGVGTIAAGVAKAGADSILIAGDSGGTGAATKTSIKSAGVPWELGLAEAQQVLRGNRLRSRVKLQVDGGLKSARDIVIAALLGAEEYGFGMASLVSLGCIMLRKCHCNTCSVGIATQDPALRKLFSGQAEHVVNYLHFVAAEVREYLAALGLRRMDELIGRNDLLRARATEDPDLAAIDLDWLLRPNSSDDAPRKRIDNPARDPDRINHQLLDLCRESLEAGKPCQVEATVDNRDRAIGTGLSFELTRRHGHDGLPPGTLRLNLKGVAGQSLGAFANRGLEIRVQGGANDHVGKGLSGARLILCPPAGNEWIAADNALIGNAALYGATAGELYVNGRAGERFAVRNSGALAVVEGIGDHGCEYMTGGVVLLLGAMGRNFAAGMSGGEAFLWMGDPRDQRFYPEELELTPLTSARDRDLVERLLRNHQAYTGSARAAAILQRWPASAEGFLKVMPQRYGQIMAEELAAGEDKRTSLPPLAPATSPSEEGITP